ncbi:MAG: hypothetical protein R6V43_02730 [Halopseudomonas sp.]
MKTLLIPLFTSLLVVASSLGVAQAASVSTEKTALIPASTLTQHQPAALATTAMLLARGEGLDRSRRFYDRRMPQGTAHC